MPSPFQSIQPLFIYTIDIYVLSVSSEYHFSVGLVFTIIVILYFHHKCMVQ